MDLVEMLIRSQGSQNISELGRQFGLDETQTRAALEQLAPVIAAGVRRNASSDDGLASLARELQGGQYARYADEPADPQLNDATRAGNQILEQIFGIPGMGLLLLDAVNQRDYPIITGVFLVVGVSVMMINLLVDLSYGLLDPRVRIRS